MKTLDKQIKEYWEINPPGPDFVKDSEGLYSFDAIKKDRYEKIPEILEEIEFALEPGMEVLEIGCGAGTDAESLFDQGAKVTAIDLTEKSIMLTKLRFLQAAKKITLKRADAKELPFENNQFDQVYSHGVLHHTDDLEKCIAEVYRVLKPGGLAKIALYHYDSLYRFYHILYKRGVLEKQYESKTKEEILSHYSESREGCPLTRFIKEEEVKGLFADFEQVNYRKASQVRVNRLLKDTEIASLQDSEMKDYFMKARQWEKEGVLEKEAGRFLYIRATK